MTITGFCLVGLEQAHHHRSHPYGSSIQASSLKQITSHIGWMPETVKLVCVR